MNSSREFIDGNEPMSRSKKFHMTLTEEVPGCFRFKRAGIIPYCSIDDEIYYLMGVDRIYRELTDFGGQVVEMDFIHAACRELEEESLGIFSLDCNDVRERSYSIYTSSSIIIFYPMSQEFTLSMLQNICSEYHTRFSSLYNLYNSAPLRFVSLKPLIENSHMIWITHTHLLKLMKQEIIKIPNGLIEGLTYYPPIFGRVRDIISNLPQKENKLYKKEVSV